MAIAKEVAAQIARVDERTLRTTINIPLDGPKMIEGIRQDVSYDAEGNVVSEQVLFPVTVRRVEDVVDETIEAEHDGDKQTVSLGIVLAAIEAFFDKWAQDDADAAAEAKTAHDEAIKDDVVGKQGRARQAASAARHAAASASQASETVASGIRDAIETAKESKR